ncbi:MAG: histone deacetylase [Desulfatitalea sp.]|nr:histone deacetylase [Desulfatitalea sp.]NNK01675.1 histone deacetylase [Desulfatitalea sp.]
MILYDPAGTVSMEPFGIRIPIRDSRATRTFAALAAEAHLGPLVHHWHHKTIGEQIDRKDLLRVHTADYVARLYSDGLEAELLSTFELIDDQGRYHRYAPDQADKPLFELFEGIVHKVAGSVQCARLALNHGFCFYFSGGMHHAYQDHGSGFCLVNDVLIAARKVQAEGLVRKVWIIDADAHKGDGTAAIAQGDATITTLSIHMASGWPLDGPLLLTDGRPNPVFTPSDIDIPIASGEEFRYLARLEQGLRQLDRSGRPQLAIVLAGADPYELDELPSSAGLRLSLPQMLARDQLIYTFLRDRNIPAAFLMAGGYGDHVWQVYAQFLSWALKRIH